MRPCVRRRLTDATGQEPLLLVAGQNAVHGVDRHDLVPRLAERMGDLHAGGERDVPLVGGAPEEDGDLHVVSALTTS